MALSKFSGEDGSEGLMAEINITPLTDIFLVLLIIFMITTSAMVESAAKVNLPKASQTGSGSNQVTPDVRHFRKMSVYVKDKRVIKVLEKIDVESRLKDLAQIYDTKFPADRPKPELAAIAVEALNVIRTGQGQDPIRMRDMEFSLKDLGTDVKVDMPTDTTKASLALLENRGRPGDAANGALEAAALRAKAGAPQPTG